MAISITLCILILFIHIPKPTNYSVCTDIHFVNFISLYLACGISSQFDVVVLLLFFSMKNILFKIPTLTHLTILCDHSGSEYQDWVPVAEATLWS